MNILLPFVVFLSLNQVYSYVNLEWEPPAFDPEFYEQFLNSELCEEQLAIIRNETTLAMAFIEPGLRVPRGILEGNFVDLGNYFQCINIDHQEPNYDIEGKYCLIDVPLNQEFSIPELPSLPDIPGIDRPEWLPELPIQFNQAKLKLNGDLVERSKFAKKINRGVEAITGQNIHSRSLTGSALETIKFRVALCVPKVCTTKQWMESFLFNVTAVGLDYTDEFCRVKDDKPWAPADYVAIVVFSILGFITLLSTCYDIWHTFILKSDPKQISTMHRCFSLYTNSVRLTTFKKVPGVLECVDGIRALSIMWVILGHTFSTLPPRQNLLESVNWILTINSTWVTAGPMSVDTFFMLSGMLLVYTTAGKLTPKKLLKNLHLFYLNRILRMFPLLAAGVLIQASFLYRLSDGPIWTAPAQYTDICRNYWWSTLLYYQNYANPWTMCLPHSWYLAIDMHLHILSPLILFWVLSGKKSAAWIAIIGSFIVWLAAATTYNFMQEFTAAIITATRTNEYQNYMMYYYVNTLTRAPPFFVGLIFGYLLHLSKEKKLELTKFTATILWVCALILILLGVFSSHPMKNADWDNQTMDSLINSFARTLWAVGIGWVVFACSRGYGGPINWFLSHQVFKLPSRLSYAMYIFHFPLMFVSAGSAVAPYYFSIERTMYRYLSELSLTLIVAFVMTVFIDSPFSTIFKLIMGGGPKRPESYPNKVNGSVDRSYNANNLEKEKYQVKL